jgi:uroporphyrinogen-III decarboxylase
VVEPYQMLGEIDEKLAEAMGVDVRGVRGLSTMFGFRNEKWKPLTLFDGTEVMVPGEFNITVAENGDWLLYPEGDITVPPSGRMPRGGYFFDSIDRQGPVDEDNLDPADNTEEFKRLAPLDVEYLALKAKAVAVEERGTILVAPGTGFGDIAAVPAPWLKHPRGIRGVAEWYMATVENRDYVVKVFEKQSEIGLKNLEALAKNVGDSAQVAMVTGTDFGTQAGLFISPKAYRELYQPFHKRINEFVHGNTKWKTFMHSCGSVIALIPDFIESGFDVLNPVQCSAAGMDPATLKREFGRDLVFWGGGVDTQQTLPFGTPDAVYKEVRERIEIFGRDGGFVFNAVHNIQAGTPVENVLAMLKAIRDSNA